MTAIKDISGLRFGKLLVVKFAKREKHHTYFECQCECGNIVLAISNDLLSGKRISCGCAHKTHGMTNTRTYKSWFSMRQRCYYSKHIYYKHYGEKGITVCDEWQSFENFFRDMGERPEGMTIDRKDSSLGYFKDNCQWSTIESQNRNKSSNIILTHNGKTQTLKEWAVELNTGYMKLWHRVKAGKTIEEILGSE